MNKKIEIIIQNGLEFLVVEQKRNGSFPSYTTTDPKDFKKATKCNSIFSTSLITMCIDEITKFSPLTKKIQEKAVQFLLNQRSENWSFNYWDRKSIDYKKMPYPDDLDDTFCSLAAIFKFDQNLLDGTAYAQIVSLLTNLEVKTGGPYRTWLVPKNADKVWLDIDLAVNSNIAYFLSLQEISIPNLSKLIDKAIALKKYSSPYYPTEFPIIYFISRFYVGSNKKKLIAYLLKKEKQNGSWNENALDTALAILSLINLGLSKDLSNNINYLINTQKNGVWNPHPFYTGINPGKKRSEYFAGSKALTTAFCLEVLSRTCEKDDSLEEKGVDARKEIIEKAGERLKKIISISEAKDFLNDFLLKDDEAQITLFPLYFSLSLKNKVKIDENFILELGLANLYGWIAYTIYDNFIDQEGDIRYLPIANLCLRELTTTYNNILPENDDFQEIFREIMDGIERSNIWEIKNCRTNIIDEKIHIPKTLPNFKNLSVLSDRAFGHALGPIAILKSLGYKTNSKEITKTKEFVKHLLIARQLLDDAHDWEEDLRRGQINSVACFILNKYLPKRIIRNQDFDDLRKIFWLEVAPKVFDLIFSRIEKSRSALNECSEIDDPKIIFNLINKIERAAEKGVLERKRTIEFLDSIEF